MGISISNNEDLAWCAGFFDGEGHTGSFLNKDKSAKFYLTIGQKDPHLLYKFRRIINGYGHMATNKIKRSYVLQITRFEHIQFTMCMLWKWLGPIKREQYRKAVMFHLSFCRKRY